MCVSLMHNFHTKSTTIKNVCPSRDYTFLIIFDGTIVVKSVQIKSHRGNPKSSKPNTNYGPGSKEEVQAAAVVEGGVLEDQATEVTVGSHDVVGLFLLAEFISVVLGLRLGGFTNKATSN